jgi:hypothetical protein
VTSLRRKTSNHFKQPDRRVLLTVVPPTDLRPGSDQGDWIEATGWERSKSNRTDVGVRIQSPSTCTWADRSQPLLVASAPPSRRATRGAEYAYLINDIVRDEKFRNKPVAGVLSDNGVPNCIWTSATQESLLPPLRMSALYSSLSSSGHMRSGSSRLHCPGRSRRKTEYAR